MYLRFAGLQFSRSLIMSDRSSDAGELCSCLDSLQFISAEDNRIIIYVLSVDTSMHKHEKNIVH